MLREKMTFFKTNENFAVQYINMREVLIKDFKDFKSLFFPENIK